MLKRTAIGLIVLLSFACVSAFAQETYKTPPQNVLDVLNAPLPPQVSVSPTRDMMLMADQRRYPPIADLAQPMLRLAGSRINPATNGPHRGTYYISLTLKKTSDGTDTKVVLP